MGSETFTLICPCVWVCVCVVPGPEPSTFMQYGKVREKHLVLLKLAEKALVTSHGHLKPVHTHCQTSGLPVQSLVGCQNHLQPANSYRSVSSPLTWALTHTHVHGESTFCIMVQTTFQQDLHLQVTCNWLTGSRNKLPGLSALRLSQWVRGASESCRLQQSISHTHKTSNTICM